MSPRTGRPVIGDSKKDAQIGFRVSRETVDKFQECADISGKSRVDLFEEMVDSLYKKLTGK